jgi:hypothetical protein
MNSAGLLALGGVLLLAATLAGSAIAKAIEARKTQTRESMFAMTFQHCDVHIEDMAVRPESRIDGDEPAIPDVRTVDVSHGADVWITV